MDTMNSNPIAIPDIATANFEAEEYQGNLHRRCRQACDESAGATILASAGLSRRFSLLQNGNVFRRLSGAAFSLDTGLTCVIEGGKIKFRSFHKLGAVINLLDVYRAATDQEVQEFATHPHFEVADAAAFTAAADQTIRKLVHAKAAS